jgi:hypothetical protein
MFEKLPDASRRALIEELGILRPELKRGCGLVGAEEAGGIDPSGEKDYKGISARSSELGVFDSPSPDDHKAD